MKIATWNVNSVRSRLEQVTNWLQANPVEVLCLQETKVVDGSFPRSPFEELGYHLYISGQKSYNGVAIFSKSPMEDVSSGFAPILGREAVENGPYGDWDEQKRVIAGVVGGVRIVNLYVPNGASVGSEKYDYKLQWLKLLRSYLGLVMEKIPAICICGDFNVALDDRDIYRKTKNSDIMASPAERQSLQSILELGFADAFRQFESEGGHFSWWDYRHGGFQRDRGWRIDYHFLTSELRDRSTSCTIDKSTRGLEKPSDHAPVIVELAS